MPPARLTVVAAVAAVAVVWVFIEVIVGVLVTFQGFWARLGLRGPVLDAVRYKWYVRQFVLNYQGGW